MSLKDTPTNELLNELATRGDVWCDACCGKWQAYFVNGTKYCHGCRNPESACGCGGHYNRNRGYRR